MPLPFTVEKELQFPNELFNEHGLAAFIAHGGRYGGHWSISAISGRESAPEGPWGTIMTCYPLSRDDLTQKEHYPDLAVDTAFVWLYGEARKRGWRLVYWENLNEEIDAESRPYFALARALFANERFIPAPGVLYADEVPR